MNARKSNLDGVARVEILITGANGLLGVHAVSRLAEEHQVHAVVHSLPAEPLPNVLYYEVDLSGTWDSGALPSKN